MRRLAIDKHYKKFLCITLQFINVWTTNFADSNTL
jgi:hypothetical protein